MKIEQFEKTTRHVKTEVDHQDSKWGDQRSNPGPLWMTILGEEYGEVCNATLERDVDNVRKEAIQVAAVCFQIIDAIDAGRFQVR